MEVIACKTFTFEAAHRLPNHKGKCRNLHGHSYKLEVAVKGRMQPPFIEDDVPNPEHGMVMDFGDLKKTVERHIDRLDHSYLNDAISNPTAETLAMNLALAIASELPDGVKLDRVRIYETPTCYAEVRL